MEMCSDSLYGCSSFIEDFQWTFQNSKLESKVNLINYYNMGTTVDYKHQIPDFRKILFMEILFME